MTGAASSDPAALVDEAAAGSGRAVARLLSMVEDDAAAVPELAAVLAARGGTSHVVGLTGSPGVGKSTTTSALVAVLRARGQRVGVLAVDPSSPYSGGALLGDRVRMSEHAADAGVFIRSMATRGHLGGLAEAAPMALRVLDAAGFDTVLIETVGVGQSEIDIAALADTTVVLLAPGMGDGIQAAKAGLLEIGDVFVVNKSDRDGAGATARELRQMLARSVRDGWEPPVLATVASRGDGVAEVADAVVAHAAWQRDSGELRRRRVRRAAEEITAVTVARVRRQVGAVTGSPSLERLAADVADGRTDAYTAATALLGG